MSQPAKLAETRRLTMAEKADRHDLYEQAVQDVESEVDFLLSTFRDLRQRDPVTFREDFCGTASACCEWVKRSPTHRAVGVDLDRPTLEWGVRNRQSRLNDEQRSRITLIEGDVLSIETEQVDLIGAFNFSYFTFNTREQLKRYFTQARSALARDGILFLDAFGGSEAFEEMKEKTKHDGFTYVWHQKTYHPVTGYFKAHIHFRFPDGSRMQKAFTYEWRLWTLPEIRELLEEAGFSRVTVYWEGSDEDGDGNGEFSPEPAGEADLGWIAYIVAER